MVCGKVREFNHAVLKVAVVRVMCQELMDVELRSLIASGQVTVSHCRLFSYQLLSALRFAHSSGVVHCSLKPSNVLVNCHDLVLKLADFQLARLASPAPEPGKLSAVREPHLCC